MISRILALIDSAPLGCGRVLSVGAVALGAVVADAAADRRRARHHQQAGAGQHHGVRRCRRSKSKSR